MIEPGKEAASAPHSDERREALNRDDDVTEAGDSGFLSVLHCRDPLAQNNRLSPHTRAAFADSIASGHPVKRPWMWRRHIGPGFAPVMLEKEEPA